jgi:hypothetical protein
VYPKISEKIPEKDAITRVGSIPLNNPVTKSQAHSQKNPSSWDLENYPLHPSGQASVSHRAAGRLVEMFLFVSM